MNTEIDVLVEKSKKGDLLAKEELMQRLMPLVSSSIRRYYFGKDELEDLIQDGGMKILTAIDDFDEKKGVPFLGYIKLALKFYYMNKGKKVEILFSLDQEVDIGNDFVPFMELLADDVDIEEEFVFEEDCNSLRQALRRLTQKQMRIVLLYYYKGLNMKRISEMLGIHYQTVVKTKKIALKKLYGWM